MTLGHLRIMMALRSRFTVVTLPTHYKDDALLQRSHCNCLLSVGRRQKTAAFDAVFGVVPTPRSASLPPPLTLSRQLPHKRPFYSNLPDRQDLEFSKGVRGRLLPDFPGRLPVIRISVLTNFFGAHLRNTLPIFLASSTSPHWTVLLDSWGSATRETWQRLSAR
jgi:hypothetical protein